jgi:hypothetical protein
VTRSRWTALAGVLFGVGFFAVTFTAGTTPDSGTDDAPARYVQYWADDEHTSRATIGAFMITYVFLLLIAFAAGLRDRLRAVDTGPLPSYVLGAGVAAAALILAGAEFSFMVGLAADDSSAFKVDGNTAILFDDMAYSLLASGLMAACSMAVVTGLVTLRTRVLPVWTAWFGFLLGLAALGSMFTVWTAFLLFPAWVIALSIVLALRKETVADEVAAAPAT